MDLKINNLIFKLKWRQKKNKNCHTGSRSSHEIGRGQQSGVSGGGPRSGSGSVSGGGGSDYGRSLYLELAGGGDMSPPSDNVLFDNQCYATTPSSSNGNSDLDQPQTSARGTTGSSLAPLNEQITFI